MNTVAKAEAKRAELVEQIQRIDTFLEVARELEADAAPHEEAKPSPARVGPLVQHTRNTVRAILQETGRTMGRDELLEALRDRGVTIKGPKPGDVLYTRLYEAPDIVLLRGMGWDLRERAAERALPHAVQHPMPDPVIAGLGGVQAPENGWCFGR